MNLLLTGAMVVLMVAAVEPKDRRPGRRPIRKLSVADAFEEYDIPEDLDIPAPVNKLTVTFGDISVNLGNNIYPGNTIERPTVQYSLDPNTDYTFIAIDPDVYSSDNEECKRTLLLALYFNIRNLNFNTAYEAAKYRGPTPRPGTGRHTYVYLLYRQTNKIDTSCDPEPNYEDWRVGFNVSELVSNFSLCELVAGNFHTAIFPDNLEETCEEYCD